MEAVVQMRPAVVDGIREQLRDDGQSAPAAYMDTAEDGGGVVSA
jgi:hypothetical protein